MFTTQGTSSDYRIRISPFALSAGAEKMLKPGCRPGTGNMEDGGGDSSRDLKGITWVEASDSSLSIRTV